ncbi:MAG: hypothetical protein AAB691_03690 [Patescibacteria group bacterium]
MKSKVYPKIAGKLRRLTTSEILSGLFLSFGARTFREDQLYDFFHRLYGGGLSRFEVVREGGRYFSEPLRTTLSFFEMGQMVEVLEGDYYRPRASLFDSMRGELISREVLPRDKDLFDELARLFAEVVEEGKVSKK